MDRRLADRSRRDRPGRRGRAPGRRRSSIRVAAQTAFRRASARGPSGRRRPATSGATAVSPSPGEGLRSPVPRTAGRGSSSRSGQLVGRHRRPVELQPARVVDLRARPCGGRGRSPRARPACGAARSGSRACTSRRCRRRAGCRRRLRARRSGGSRGRRETRKSSSLVVNVAPSGVRTCRVDLVQVEVARRRGCPGTPRRRRPTRSASARTGRPGPGAPAPA